MNEPDARETTLELLANVHNLVGYNSRRLLPWRDVRSKRYNAEELHNVWIRFMTRRVPPVSNQRIMAQFNVEGYGVW